MKLWEGLGYYSRARNLQKAARVVMESCGGQLPDTYEELLKLPGIGSYTAGAVASIACGRPVPAVDGNVLRVWSRLFCREEDILKQSVKTMVEEEITAVIPKDCPGAYNQAWMELGALVCVPNGKAHCEECPLAFGCRAKAEDRINEFPKKTPKKPRRIEISRCWLSGMASGRSSANGRKRGCWQACMSCPTYRGHEPRKRRLP